MCPVLFLLLAAFWGIELQKANICFTSMECKEYCKRQRTGTPVCELQRDAACKHAIASQWRAAAGGGHLWRVREGMVSRYGDNRRQWEHSNDNCSKQGAMCLYRSLWRQVLTNIDMIYCNKIVYRGFIWSQIMWAIWFEGRSHHSLAPTDILTRAVQAFLLDSGAEKVWHTSGSDISMHFTLMVVMNITFPVFKLQGTQCTCTTSMT